MTSPTLLTEADLAGIFGVDVRTIADWRRKQDWPHVRVGRVVRFTEEQVESIIAANTKAPAPAPRLRTVRVPGQTQRSIRRRTVP